MLKLKSVCVCVYIPSLILTQPAYVICYYVSVSFHVLTQLLLCRRQCNNSKVLTEFEHWCKFYGIPYDTEFCVHCM